MARMHSTVELDDGFSVTVHELTVKQIIEILNDKALGESGELEMKSIQGFVSRHLEKATDLKFDKIVEMAPSELKLVYDKFAEVNATFFATARAVGLDQLLTELKNALVEDFGKLLAGSLNRDM